ncbi:MAG: hypothetical protein A2731_02510 [Candidatus Buchananbacteria bacterium RIFCSPHIGHO2_01_FULL_39_8]|uniref:DNA methylase adenine-specific domain-containing protein n=1 Tax=Candidatus Buchananbacteria bacterium RIFCSPHIGHO2_01_FULL_39_8 TaxID=1797533 RepID=A0A1G1XXG4_9BACT|nr:MAG: hypothetical protein A2731_02510 [Candidatus Buchananbacteria bacterium RIFCSPHIGHO2_01_FULL_39_8]
MIETILTLIVFLITGVCLVVSLLIGSSVIALFFTRVPFVPTPKRNVEIIIDQLDLKPGQVFYDLGCGDGRFLLEAEKRGAKAIGFEISPWAYFRGRINLFLHRSKAQILYQNFYHHDTSGANAIFCFLMDNVMLKVEKKLKTELKPGAKIACYGFKLPTWPPTKIIDLKPKDKRSSNIYLYIK